MYKTKNNIQKKIKIFKKFMSKNVERFFLTKKNKDSRMFVKGERKLSLYKNGYQWNIFLIEEL